MADNNEDRPLKRETDKDKFGKGGKYGWESGPGVKVTFPHEQGNPAERAVREAQSQAEEAQ